MKVYWHSVLPPILERSKLAISPFSLRRFVRYSPESSRIFDDSKVSTRTCLTSVGLQFTAIQYPPNTSPALISYCSTSINSSPDSLGLSCSCASCSISRVTRSFPVTTTYHCLEACAFRDSYTICPCFPNSNSLPPVKSSRQTLSGASWPRLVFISEQKIESVRSFISLCRNELLPEIKKVIGSSCGSDSSDPLSFSSMPTSSAPCRDSHTMNEYSSTGGKIKKINGLGGKLKKSMEDLFNQRLKKQGKARVGLIQMKLRYSLKFIGKWANLHFTATFQRAVPHVNHAFIENLLQFEVAYVVDGKPFHQLTKVLRSFYCRFWLNFGCITHRMCPHDWCYTERFWPTRNAVKRSVHLKQTILITIEDGGGAGAQVCRHLHPFNLSSRFSDVKTKIRAKKQYMCTRVVWRFYTDLWIIVVVPNRLLPQAQWHAWTAFGRSAWRENIILQRERFYFKKLQCPCNSSWWLHSSRIGNLSHKLVHVAAKRNGAFLNSKSLCPVHVGCFWTFHLRWPPHFQRNSQSSSILEISSTCALNKSSGIYLSLHKIIYLCIQLCFLVWVERLRTKMTRRQEDIKESITARRREQDKNISDCRRKT